MKLFTCLLFACLSSSPSFSQDPDPEADIRAQIAQLFEGMYKGDSAMVRKTLHPEAQFSSTFFDEAGKPAYRKGSVKNFLNAIGTPHEKVWDEQIDNLTLHIDDNLAQAWMNYRFVLGGELSHCGVNAMTLVNTDHGWQILYLSDSRRKTPCPE